MPPAAGRAIDCVGSRTRRPILLNSRGARMDRHAATRRLRHVAVAAGVRISRPHEETAGVLHCRKGAVMSADDEQPVKSAHEAGRSGKRRKRLSQLAEGFSDRWMLGRQLADLDDWPSADENLGEPAIDPALYRLNWSIKWHTLAHLQATRWYTGIKILEITAAAAIPVLTVTGGTSFGTRGWVAGLGALVVVLEGIQQLKKYAQNALLWGQGKEALKREYYLYEAGVSPYSSADREMRLASRVEQIIGQEVAQWAARNEDKNGNGVSRGTHPEAG
jgi:hypothetical protein